MHELETYFRFLGDIEETPIKVHYSDGEGVDNISGIERIKSGEYCSIENYSDELKMKLYDHLIKERDESISYEID
jgi:hypothetical protein